MGTTSALVENLVSQTLLLYTRALTGVNMLLHVTAEVVVKFLFFLIEHDSHDEFSVANGKVDTQSTK